MHEGEGRGCWSPCVGTRPWTRPARALAVGGYEAQRQLPARACATMGEAATTRRMAACRGLDCGAPPSQRARSRPAMASAERGMGEGG
jgi:hypothetical protein